MWARILLIMVTVADAATQYTYIRAFAEPSQVSFATTLARYRGACAGQLCALAIRCGDAQRRRASLHNGSTTRADSGEPVGCCARLRSPSPDSSGPVHETKTNGHPSLCRCSWAGAHPMLRLCARRPRTRFALPTDVTGISWRLTRRSNAGARMRSNVETWPSPASSETTWTKSRTNTTLLCAFHLPACGGCPLGRLLSATTRVRNASCL